MADEKIQQVIEAIKDLKVDNTIPKNVKLKLDMIVDVLLSNEEDISIKVNKSLHELDEISDDSNLQAYTRTQIWNIASVLEML